MNSLPNVANIIIFIRLKREFKIILQSFCILVLILFFGCSKDASKTEQKSHSAPNKISVITTIFPEYEWVKSLAEGVDSVEVSTLLKKGTDFHNFEPSTPDLIAIQKADIFIYVGSQADFWVDDVLKKSINKNQIAISLNQLLDNYGNDEHVWFSVKYAKKSVQKIAESLIALDLKNAESYRTNLKTYQEKLDSLQIQIEQISSFAKNKIDLEPLFFCDKFPFKLLMEELNLAYYAPLDDGSNTGDTSFQNVSFLVQKAKELKPKAIFVTENSDLKLAKTVIHDAKLDKTKIIVLNSMQSLKNQKADGDYINLMQDNLRKIRSVIE